jgi:hypothetical protein
MENLVEKDRQQGDEDRPEEGAENRTDTADDDHEECMSPAPPRSCIRLQGSLSCHHRTEVLPPFYQNITET